MRVISLLLLLSGWALVLSALVLLALPVPRAGFVLAGASVEILGVALLARANKPPRGRPW